MNGTAYPIILENQIALQLFKKNALSFIKDN